MSNKDKPQVLTSSGQMTTPDTRNGEQKGKKKGAEKKGKK